MNYLQLVQDLAQECLIGSTPPTTLVEQPTDITNCARWIVQAYEEIQLRPIEWRWLRRRFRITTTAGDGTYAYGDCQDITDAAATIDRFSNWMIPASIHTAGRTAPTIYLQSAGAASRTYLAPLDWNRYQQIVPPGQANSRPVHIVVDPQDRIILSPTPNDTYIIEGEYYRGPQTLSDEEDVPEMPAPFHRLIVYRALEKYGFNQVSQESLARAAKDGNRMMRQLESRQRPTLYMPSPFAE